MVLWLLVVLLASKAWWLAWDFVFRKELCKHKDEYAALLTTSCVQAVLSLVFYPVAVLVCGKGGWSGDYRENCLLEYVFLSASTGFFLHDTSHWSGRLTLNSLSYLLHHLGTLALLLTVQLYGSGALCVLKMAALMEFQTPLLLLRHCLGKESRGGRLTELVYFLLYAILRFVVCVQVSLEYSRDSRMPTELKFAGVLAFLSSVSMFPGILRATFKSSRLKRPLSP